MWLLQHNSVHTVSGARERPKLFCFFLKLFSDLFPFSFTDSCSVSVVDLPSTPSLNPLFWLHRLSFLWKIGAACSHRQKHLQPTCQLRPVRTAGLGLRWPHDQAEPSRPSLGFL